jgi:hypothetical protein
VVDALVSARVLSDGSTLPSDPERDLKGRCDVRRWCGVAGSVVGPFSGEVCLDRPIAKGVDLSAPDDLAIRIQTL